MKHDGTENISGESARPAFRPGVLVPTYNNAGTLEDVLRRVDYLDLPVIVVDDGSTDQTPEILRKWERERGAAVRVVATHPVNRGKAAALRTGFAAADQRGFTHAVTIDSDGQLLPEQIPAMLRGAQKSPDSLVLGVRDEAAAGYPTKSKVGRRVSNFLVKAQSGAEVQDSQCGLRVYPLALMKFLKCRAQRYAFETEVLTRAAWAGGTFVEVPVTCHYPHEDERVSHFRPWVDSWRGVGMHGPLLLRALTPVAHKRWERAPEVQRESAKSSWSHFVDSINPLAAYRQLKTDSEAVPAMAVALGVGVWIANLPLYGIQTLFGIYASRRLHLNTLGVVVGTQISTPPIGPVLVAIAIGLGHILTHGSLPAIGDLNVRALGWRQVLGPILLDWAVGGAIFGMLMGVATFFVSMPLLRAMRAQRAEDGEGDSAGCAAAPGAVASR
ncbi:MAG TPA: DUF2062 domain-containing protein [Tepidisphaeraceae bacterium]